MEVVLKTLFSHGHGGIFAYIDPSTGSLIFQVLAASAITRRIVCQRLARANHLADYRRLAIEKSRCRHGNGAGEPCRQRSGHCGITSQGCLIADSFSGFEHD